MPPTIELEDRELSVVEEREVMMGCRVSGLPTPVVQWSKDNVTISPDDVRYRIVGSHWLAIPIVR